MLGVVARDAGTPGKTKNKKKRRHWLCVTRRYLSKSRLGDSTSNRKVSQCVKKRNKSFPFVQNFIYNLLFDKVGICGLLEFVVITGRRAHVLHCIVKGDILEDTIVGFLPNFWWTICDKFANF